MGKDEAITWDAIEDFVATLSPVSQRRTIYVPCDALVAMVNNGYKPWNGAEIVMFGGTDDEREIVFRAFDLASVRFSELADR